MQAAMNLSDLIGAALEAGHSTTELMRMAGCSRMHLWRMRSGKVPEGSPAAQRLRSAIEGDGLPTLMEAVLSSVRRLVAEDPRRAEEVLAMLQSVTALSSPPEARPGVAGLPDGM